MANCPPPFSLHLRPLFVQLQYNYTLHMLGTKFFLRTKQLSTNIIYVRLLKYNFEILNKMTFGVYRRAYVRVQDK